MLSATPLFPPPPAVGDVGDIRPGDTAVSLQDMLRARLPRLIVTPLILAAIVAIYIGMAASAGEVRFSLPTLDRWGAQFGPAIANGQWWRLLTAMWLHTHPLHLLLNAVFLWRFGAYVERLLGPVVFLIVYLLAGVIASVVSLLFGASNVMSVGASGALFGLVGVLLMVAMTSRGSGVLGDMLAELRPNLISVVVSNLILGFLVQGIDNAAHVGGLGGGLVLGWLVGRHSLEAIPPPRVTVIPVVITAGIAAAAVVFISVRPDVRKEVARGATPINAAETAFRTARTDIAAGRRQAADVADDAERTVLPFIHDAQRRADEVLRAAWARTAGAPRDRDGRLQTDALPVDVRNDLSLSTAWANCLARYDYAWGLRVAGLRAGDASRIAEGDARATAAIRDLSKTLAGG